MNVLPPSEIAELMSVKSKHGAGGEYSPEWRPKVSPLWLPMSLSYIFTFNHSSPMSLLQKPVHRHHHQTMPQVPLVPLGVRYTKGLSGKKGHWRRWRLPRLLPHPHPSPLCRTCPRGHNGGVSGVYNIMNTNVNRVGVCL